MLITLSEEYITKGDIQSRNYVMVGVKRSSSPSTSHNIHFHSAAAADDVKVDYKFLAESLVIFMEMCLHIQDFMFISESFVSSSSSFR